jgi:pimeloyl-ACP methyl ester carboxylesterase
MGSRDPFLLKDIEPMLRLVPAVFPMAIVATMSPAAAQELPFPASFQVQEIAVNGTTIHVRVGGEGPPVLLIHGYGETGDMWSPMAADLARDHRVIVPDLRGMGLSAHADGGFDKKNEAADMAGVLDKLGAASADVVAHDIGNMVAYALAMQHPERVTKLVVIDAPIPGIGPWEEILKSPMLWHFRFGGSDMERLVAGRERIYLDRFWNDFAADPKKISEVVRRHYAALYARPGAMHDGFLQFAAFDQDAIDNRAMLAAHGKLPMPVLALGGEKAFGTMMATVMRATAVNVEQGIVPNSGHWIMDENPAVTIAMVRSFLEKP